MSSHVVYFFELFIFNKIYFRSSKVDEFIVVLEQLIANRVLKDIRVQGVEVYKIVTLVQFLPLLILHEFYALNGYSKVNFFLKQISLVVYLYIL